MLRVLSGAEVSDTIGAVLAELLVVVVEGTDGPLANAGVRFQSSGAADVRLGAPGSPPAASFHEAQTDQDGIARAAIGFGLEAGAGQVTVSLAGEGVSASVTYAIEAGAPVDVRVAPADTALLIGSTFSMRVDAVDRAGNATEASASVASASPAVLTIVDGNARGVATGRAVVVGRYGADAVDTAYVSVVPALKLIAVARFPGVIALLLFDADGSSRVVLHRLEGDADSTFHPDWHPTNGLLAYEQPYGQDARAIWKLDLNGVKGTEIDPTLFGYASWPQYSADGQWLYFAGHDFDDPHPFRIWRVEVDGFTREAIGPAAGPAARAPSPSPDGTRVAFGAADDSIRVMNVDDGIARAIASGRMPRWSPDGEKIAHLDEGAIWLVGPDGANRRLLTADLAWLDGSLDWSPDGQWLAARSGLDGRLYLVDARTGGALPLPYTDGWSQPAFAPPNVGP